MRRKSNRILFAIVVGSLMLIAGWLLMEDPSSSAPESAVSRFYEIASMPALLFPILFSAAGGADRQAAAAIAVFGIFVWWSCIGFGVSNLIWRGSHHDPLEDCTISPAGSDANSISSPDASGSRAPTAVRDVLILGLLTLPFLLNDFANIFVTDYRLWLGIDYIFVKALPLSLIFYFLRSKRLSYSDLGIRRLPLGQFVAWTILMTVVGIVLDQFGSRFFTVMLPDTRLGRMPPVLNPLLDWIDLSLGLLLVGVVEEVIFRGLYRTILQRYISSRPAVFAISAAMFGLGHWSNGLSAIVHTSLIGVVFMICASRTGSVLPLIVAHFLVDYVAFH